jgi:hypothetical protein
MQRKAEKEETALREELRMKEDGCSMPIKEVRVKEQGNKPKDELYKKSIKTAASTLYGLTVASKIFQGTSNWRRIEKNLKKF